MHYRAQNSSVVVVCTLIALLSFACDSDSTIGFKSEATDNSGTKVQPLGYCGPNALPLGVASHQLPKNVVSSGCSSVHEQRSELTSEKLLGSYRFTRDERGHWLREYLSTDNKWVASERTILDQSGRLLSREHLRANGTIFQSRVQRFDSNGRLTFRRRVLSNGRIYRLHGS